MGERIFSAPPTLSLDVPYRAGAVRCEVWLAPNLGPEDSGFGAIADIGPRAPVRGFPVLKAAVSATTHGYENLFAWVQTVAHLGRDGRVEDWSPDVLPSLLDRDVPFACIGYCPTFYDAPFWPKRPRLHWRADLFLCPMAIRRPAKEEIRPIAGFRWGFRIPRPGAEPQLLPLEPVGPEAWAESLARLREHYPRWRFGEWASRTPR